MRARIGLVLFVLCASTACENQRSPVGPTTPEGSVEGSTLRLAQEVRQQWSPYVGVQVTGEALEAYQDALARLARSGNLKGVRVEIRKSNAAGGARVIKTIGSLGLELLGLVDNEYLFDADIEQVIDRIFATYPEIRYFQIGNEITTILPASGPTMSIEQYMDVFQRIYDHVQSRHPGRAVLLTQSTFGSGLHGPTELETMAALGLADMDPAKVIVAINDYNPNTAVQYVGLLGSTLRRHRVWVTETGVSNAEAHVEYVQGGYRLLRNYLRAERVYWFVMWGGDSGDHSGYSLIKSPEDYPNYWTSPLFNVLAGPQ
jgi:hypothetical protein